MYRPVHFKKTLKYRSKTVSLKLPTNDEIELLKYIVEKDAIINKSPISSFYSEKWSIYSGRILSKDLALYEGNNNLSSIYNPLLCFYINDDRILIECSFKMIDLATIKVEYSDDIKNILECLELRNANMFFISVISEFEPIKNIIINCINWGFIFVEIFDERANNKIKPIKDIVNISSYFCTFNRRELEKLFPNMLLGKKVANIVTGVNKRNMVLNQLQEWNQKMWLP